jgi:hypothetical protein
MFELVDFFGPYHVILGWPCYINFMAIPIYAYLMLKIPGPTVCLRTPHLLCQWGDTWWPAWCSTSKGSVCHHSDSSALYYNSMAWNYIT